MQHNIWRLPSNRFGIIRFINNWLIRIQVKDAFENFDIIWVTTPAFFPYLTKTVKQKAIVYDCMDDILAFSAIANNRSMYNQYFLYEKELVSLASTVICSSEYLKAKLVERYSIGNADHIHVVNNGINIYQPQETMVLPASLTEAYNSQAKILTYIGTISDWFDFELVLQVLEQHSELLVYLFGPAEVKIPQHTRLKHFGPIDHKSVFGIMEKAEVLIMPFIVNDLIKSVNPVKAYEYIFSNKIVLLNAYGETQKFGEFVYLFDSREVFKEYVSSYIKGKLAPKRTIQECHDFALQHTWDKRAERLYKILDGKLHD